MEKIKSTQRVRFWFHIILIYSGLTFFYSFIELSSLGRATYYSDSEYYYEMQRSAISWLDCDGGLYIAVLRWFGVSKISYDIGKTVIFAVYLVMVIFGYSLAGNHRLIYALCMLHPFCVFSFIRGMKESIIVLLYLAAGLILRLNGRNLIFFLVAGCLAFAMSFIRPLGEFYVIAAFLLSLIWKRYNVYKNIALYLVIILGIWADIPIVGEVLKDHKLGYAEAKVEYNLLVQPLVFAFGPTPIKPILQFFGANLYEFSTPLTLLTLFVGSFVSIYLAKSLYKMFRKNDSGTGESLFLYSSFVLLASYVILYGGQGEPRYRGLFFNLLGISFLLSSENVASSRSTNVAGQIWQPKS